MPIVQTIISQTYLDPELGPIHITVRRGVRNFTASWRRGEVHITIPQRTTAEEYKRIFEDMKPRLAAKRPQQAGIYPGWHEKYTLFDISVIEDAVNPTCITSEYLDRDFRHFRLRLGTKLNLNDGRIQQTVNKHLKRAGIPHFNSYIAARVAELARRHGLSEQVKEVKCGTGLNRLGYCTGSGVISISIAVTFLPEHLRDYVILHELAHLLHHDHSAAFHEVVNSFTDGHEATLEKQLRAFKFPFLK